MKNYILSFFLFFALCVSTPTFAQLNIIPKIGVNTVDIRNDLDDYAFEGSRGYNVGVDFRIGEKLIVQPGIHYYKLKTELEDISNEPVANLNGFSNTSIRVPLMIGRGIGENEQLQFRILAGGLAAFRMKVDSEDVDFFNDEDNFKAATFSAIGGVGVDISRIAINLTYEYGLSDILEEGNGTRNNIASLTLGFVF